jgi:hypothetical protein
MAVWSTDALADNRVPERRYPRNVHGRESIDAQPLILAELMYSLISDKMSS